ncbi:MAG: acyl-CoA thioesterase II [Myxococcaceae bacterium]|nr:acyl-CoA thioesterase II [Myxococcaceae bacterium]
MSDVLNQLVQLLTLERIEENLFRGQSQDLGWGQVFGGQVLGQALSAAARTVPADRRVHSFHGYFLLTGRVDLPIVYDVDRIRDGKSFTTRRVRAIQKGQAIFSMSASFQVQEDGFEHQAPMPQVDGPDGLPSQTELARRILDQLPPPLRDRFAAESPVEIRPIDPQNPMNPDVRPPHSAAWIRSNGRLPDDPALHRYLLAYASDFNFLSTAMYPHGVSWLKGGMQVASLDHAMWFHRDFRMDDWLLQVVESPSASGGRGLALARFYSRDGRLVASSAQEGLIRRRHPR